MNPKKQKNFIETLKDYNKYKTIVLECLGMKIVRTYLNIESKVLGRTVYRTTYPGRHR